MGLPPGYKFFYKAVNLTSYVANTLDRILHNRLYYLAEVRDWVCNGQADRRIYRSCIDLALRLMLSSRDGYPTKTVLALLNYSKTLDRIWGEDLLLGAIDKGLPIAYTQWLRDFLSNRKQKCRSTGTEADSYHWARDFLKGPSSGRSSFCCISTAFDESNPKRGGDHVCRRCVTLRQSPQHRSR